MKTQTQIDSETTTDRASHTSGEWNGKDGQIYSLKTGKTLAVIPYFDEQDGEQDANQKLLAAAPELLEALKKAKEIIERMSDEYSEVAGKHASYTRGESRVIENAIHKATN